MAPSWLAPGMGLLYLTRTFPDMPIVVLAAGNEAALEVEVIRQGAQDFIRKDGADEVMLERSIRFAIERKRLEAACRLSRCMIPLRDYRTARFFSIV
jgi:FixJ family two-component response regulator